MHCDGSSDPVVVSVVPGVGVVSVVIVVVVVVDGAKITLLNQN